MQAFLNTRWDSTSSESARVRSMISCSSCLWEDDEAFFLPISCRSYISLRIVELSLCPATVCLFCTSLYFLGYSIVRGVISANTAELRTSLSSDKNALLGELLVFGDRPAALTIFTDGSSSLLPMGITSVLRGNKMGFSFPLTVPDRERSWVVDVHPVGFVRVGDSSPSTENYSLYFRYTRPIAHLQHYSTYH